MNTRKLFKNFIYLFRRLTDMAFLRPFILLNLMRIGIEWGGFPALGKVYFSSKTSF